MNVVIPSIFCILNGLLLFWHWEAIPSWDKIFVVVSAFVLQHVVQTKKKQHSRLNKSNLFRYTFAVLSLLEVVVTVIIPWVLLVQEQVSGDRNNNTSDGQASTKTMVAGYLLAPHLFVFQAQIALESLVENSADKNGDMFYYTCVANGYRSLALYTWIHRTAQEQRPFRADNVLAILPILASIIWICSNTFIAMIWYPCLKPLNRSHQP